MTRRIDFSPPHDAADFDAIAELVKLLQANGELVDAKRVLDAVLDREATRTTGIGNGLAIPHGKCAGTNHLVMAIGKAANPIEFQAIDGRPVTIIWMLASPPEMTTPHIQALARISRLICAANAAGCCAESMVRSIRSSARRKRCRR